MSDALQPPRHDYRARVTAQRHGGSNHLTQRTFAFVLAGGRGTRLQQLTDDRAKPAVPFAGKLKIIDFALSNCVNSGIRRIGVLTQYKAQSLIRHIERGWGFLAADLGEYVDVVPAQQRVDERLVRRHRRRRVPEPGHPARGRCRARAGPGRRPRLQDGLRASCWPSMSAAGADVTVACIEVPLAEAGNFGVMAVDDDGPHRRASTKSPRGPRRCRARRPRARQHGHLRLRRAPSCASSSSATRPTRTPATTSART